MRQLMLKHRPPAAAVLERSMPPGAGLVVAGLASVALWGVIAGIAAIV